MPAYEAVYDKGCSSFIHMDGGLYGGSEWMYDGRFSLEECAAAVWAYNGIDGCMGDYFYFEWGYVDGSGSGGACASDRLSRARRPGACFLCAL